IENMFFVSANPWVSFTSFDLNVANMDNFFAPVFTMVLMFDSLSSISFNAVVYHS
ncbi:TPA_asm: hypothetical protein GNA91_004989, partial [Salmonella enterica subsp. enterica serovar Typhimurium]|nr:hypothetical protein [Salmonella enterica subsp. enterica serovar Typhimurium]